MLAVAQAMAERLQSADGAAALEEWAAEYGQTEPRVELGYRRPTKAQDWPYVALVPTRDVRDLIEREIRSAQVNVACGVRLEQVERGTALGLVAVDALAETVLMVLSEPACYAAYGSALGVVEASRVDVLNQHPHYELEIAIALRRLGDG